MSAITAKIKRARRMRVAPQMKPLRDHVLRLAKDSAQRGYCQRAGQEIRKAVRIAEQAPTYSSHERAAGRRK